MNTLSLQLK